MSCDGRGASMHVSFHIVVACVSVKCLVCMELLGVLARPLELNGEGESFGRLCTDWTGRE